MDTPTAHRDGLDMDLAYAAKKIDELEAEIAAWKAAAGEWDCSTPAELKERIFSLPYIY